MPVPCIPTSKEAKEIHDKEGHDIGLIAQDVEKIIPEVVGEWKGHKVIDYGKLTPLLIDAIKELKEEVEGLKDQIRMYHKILPISDLEDKDNKNNNN